jgi:hypothetical protein
VALTLLDADACLLELLEDPLVVLAGEIPGPRVGHGDEHFSIDSGGSDDDTRGASRGQLVPPLPGSSTIPHPNGGVTCSALRSGSGSGCSAACRGRQRAADWAAPLAYFGHEGSATKHDRGSGLSPRPGW